jgi:cytochrome o ubiquinol oxidase subunit 2
MSKSKKIGFGKVTLLTMTGFVFLGFIVSLLLRGNDVILFNPKGIIAAEQHRLLVVSTLIMLGFAIPVLFLIYFFAWRYRETNHKVTYSPRSRNSKLSVVAVWTIPTIVLFMLASIMLPATQKLEPQRQIDSNKETLKIQVVALRWKWLFIYPEQNIATINFAQIPIDTPVQFELTADETPMSSFWIPHLGGMLYAMTEHVNRLNLMADTLGDYQGSAAEINGPGFAGMRFKTRVSTQEDFDNWAKNISLVPSELSSSEYDKLLVPSENNQAAFYSNPSEGLYSTILSKYGSAHAHSIEEYEGH